MLHHCNTIENNNFNSKTLHATKDKHVEDSESHGDLSGRDHKSVKAKIYYHRKTVWMPSGPIKKELS